MKAKNCAFLLFVLTVFSTQALAQKADKKLTKQLQADVEYLASDELGGRLAGSEEEKVAAEYIQKRFKKLGLEEAPYLASYFMPFSFSTPIEYANTGNSLKVSKKSMVLDKDFYPVPVSGNGSAQGTVLDIGFGIEAPELEHNDLKDVSIQRKIVLVNLGSPDGIHPHSKFLKYHSWRNRIETLAKKEPKAIICHSGNESISIAALKRYNNLERLAIPVLHVEKEALERINLASQVNLSVNLVQEEKQSLNVLGYLDKGAVKTVVVGAHYDHLGLGEYGNSRYIGEEPLIHNGADDNASGVALMLALAEELSEKEEDLSCNYLFMAFSAEELGLLGSNAFVNTEVFKKFDINYMLNFDMVGRLNEKNELGIFGTGTSTAWPEVFTRLDTLGLIINRSPTGMGSSDHTSFYLNDVPVLHYFTGTHEDYHKPSDDADKINYQGMLRVLKLSVDMCFVLDTYEEVDFRKTKTGNSRKAPSFKVTLGIIPDYFGDAKGLKIDGVSKGKPAEAAGLQKGDIIVKMGETAVKDMMTYMEALRAFDKGDETTVDVLRGDDAITLKVKF